MYAVIRAGGKQYRVAPGDVIKVEKMPVSGDTVEFNDVLAVSATEGEIAPGAGARVVGQVLGEVRGDKILVFHFKRKKQYKKLRGHRQNYTQVRIAEIAFDGQSFKAPDAPVRKAKGKGVVQAAVEGVAAVAGAVAGAVEGATAKPAKKKAAAKKSAAKKTAAKKSTKKK